MDNGTWDLVSYPTKHDPIGWKWVFRSNLQSKGELDKYKARLVANGHHLVEGIDFSKTYSPVVKSQTIKLVLTLALAQEWELKQLDVNNSFLINGELQETFFIHQSQGFIDKDHSSWICKLKKVLYG